MIETKQDLKNAIIKDRKRYNCSTFGYLKGLILSQDKSHAIRLLKVLRKTEYYLNNKDKWWGKVMYILYYIIYSKLQFKYDTYIYLNSCEPGLWIPHLGGIIINCEHMGANCSVNKGVVIGNKVGQENRAIIGNNCYFTLGCKVIGRVSIGDGVIVAQNAVVTKDVESFTLVGGIPAKKIKSISSISDIKI